MIKKILIIILSLIAVVIVFCVIYKPPLPHNHGKIDSKLFLSKSVNQPLIVAFGGSGGGILFAEESEKAFRDKALSLGYAFLAIGYFRTENTSSELDRISLDAIFDTIQNYRKHSLINGNKIVIIGVSRGGELVLNLASKYKDFDAVISIVPSNLSMNHSFNMFGLFETSAWTINDKEIPCLSSTFKTRRILRNEGFYKALSAILKNETNVKKAEIPVENINCPVLIISAKNDEVWPSTYMSNQIIKRLQDNNFRYYNKHIIIDGGHGSPFQNDNDNLIFDFLKEQLKKE